MSALETGLLDSKRAAELLQLTALVPPAVEAVFVMPASIISRISASEISSVWNFRMLRLVLIISRRSFILSPPPESALSNYRMRHMCLVTSNENLFVLFQCTCFHAKLDCLFRMQGRFFICPVSGCRADYCPLSHRLFCMSMLFASLSPHFKTVEPL